MPSQNCAYLGPKDLIDFIISRKLVLNLLLTIKEIYCFSDAENAVMHVNVPISKPSGYNASLNPVIVKLNLDPNCRYQVS